MAHMDPAYKETLLRLLVEMYNGTSTETPDEEAEPKPAEPIYMKLAVQPVGG